MHAERDIVMAFLSVCLSVRLSSCLSNAVLCLNELKYRHRQDFFENW